MSDTIDQIYKHSMDWQKPLLWMRINLGYMRSEIKNVASAGGDVAGLKLAVGQLEEALVAFVRSEMVLFEEACTSDRSPHMSALLIMQRPLSTMRNALEENVVVLREQIRNHVETQLNTRSLPVCSHSIGEVCKAHIQV